MDYKRTNRVRKIDILFLTNCDYVKKIILSAFHGKELSMYSELHTHYYKTNYNDESYRISILYDNPDNEIKNFLLNKLTKNLFYKKDIFIFTQIFKKEETFSKFDFNKNIETIDEIEKKNSEKYKSVIVYIFGIFVPKVLEEEFNTGEMKDVDLIFVNENEDLNLYEIENTEILSLNYIKLKSEKKDLEKLKTKTDTYEELEITEEIKKIATSNEYYDRYRIKKSKTIDIRFYNIIMKKNKDKSDLNKINKELTEKIIKISNDFHDLKFKKIKDVDYDIKTNLKQLNREKETKSNQDYCKIS